jgi:hypothetical protein
LLVDEPTTAPTIDCVDPSDGSRQSVHVIGRYDEPGHAIGDDLARTSTLRATGQLRDPPGNGPHRAARYSLPPNARRGHPGRNILKSVVSPSDELT